MLFIAMQTILSSLNVAVSILMFAFVVPPIFGFVLLGGGLYVISFIL